ncbi:hypothetical protein [Pontixanthobacter aquaemixtae]|uniref:hypothetical protein n=1 Tax=Pontixanthobacter aquaemixtae TaxID=1958940 RepID=UPI00136D76EC|nr:hypothetical protein [Pontixanthobacter aquaemixtae]
MKAVVLLTFDRLKVIATTAKTRSAASQDHNKDFCGPVYASEITGIRFLSKGKTRFWQFRQLRLLKGIFDETFESKYQPAGAASEEASTSREETQVVKISGSGVSGHPYMDAAAVEGSRYPLGL